MSARVNPSWAVTKLTVAQVRRPWEIEQVARSGDPRREFGDLALVALPEPADGVAVTVVPLRPARGKTTQAVAALAHVPGLGDQLDPGQHRVLAHGVEKARVIVETAVFLARQRGREIETEAVHVHVLDPVAQRVHDHLENPGVAKVEGVAAPREVHVVALVSRHEMVIRCVVDTAPRQRRPHLVALGGVVVHHVENDLDTGAMQGLDERLELAELTGGQETRVRREK